jgi:uncharacterized protein
MGGLNALAARKAAIILCILAGIEGGFVLAAPHLWLSVAFGKASHVNAVAWIATTIVTVAYIIYGVRGLPEIVPLLGTVSPFKSLALLIAVPSAIVEEVFFRSSLMNVMAYAHYDVLLQIAGSAIAFGIAHAFWGLRGGFGAMLSAIGSTTMLGLALPIVFLFSGRIVFPCVVAHFVINLVLEPWLLYAYIARAQPASLPAA